MQSHFLVRVAPAVLLIALLATLVVMPQRVSAKDGEGLEVAGWLPYWSPERASRDARAHLNDVDAIYPFAYVVKADGSLKDLASLSKSHWKRLFKDARKKDVELIPTVMWSDRAQMETTLSDASLRAGHVKAVAGMVKKGKYEGVDIDYEAKSAETRDGFSLFLKELKSAIGSKVLVCTIEARTPADSLYKVIPDTMQYSNDYKEINKHCDRVQLMAYDQQRADLKLNESKAGQPYMPLSDVDWVRKVIELALQDFPKEKIMLGIASYGHHYEVTVAPNWYKSYRRIGALNVPDMLEVADEYDVEPSRNRAGEMSFTYIPKSSGFEFPKNIKAPKGTSSGNEVAAKALEYANQTGQEVKFNIGWYSDAEAMFDKVELAREYDLRGYAFFKIDGEEDKNIWGMID